MKRLNRSIEYNNHLIFKEFVQRISIELIFSVILQCKSRCGPGISTRKIVCRDPSGKKVGDRRCKGRKPAKRKRCQNTPCGGAEWIVSPWQPVSQTMDLKPQSNF